MRKIVLDKDLLYQKYIIENKTIPEVAQEFGVCHNVISKNLKYYNIKGKSNKIPELDKDILEDLYSNKLFSIRKIAEMLNVPETQIRKSLNFHKIEKRTRHWKSSINKNGMIVDCAICGKKIYRKKYSIKKYTIFFCSWDCEKKYQSITRSTSDLPEAWRQRNEYKKWRRKVLKRDSFQCKLCKSKEKIVAHHIIEVQDNTELKYEVNNGITLCQKCHIEIHKNNSRNFIESLQEAILVENPNIGETPEMDNP